MLLIGSSGCYASHIIPLKGERYECLCQYEVAIPCADLSATVGFDDDDGSVEFECSVFGGSTSLVTSRPKPCREDEHDPDEVCELECAANAPFGTEEAAGVSGEYLGQGICSDEEGYYWPFPEVPIDAVRNGRVVPEASEFSIRIVGPDVDASSGPISPNSTIVSISGSPCAGSGVGPCEGTVTDGRIETDSFSLEGRSAAGMWMQFSNQWPMQVAAGTPSEWRFRLGSPDAPTVEFEIYGITGLGDLDAVPGSFEWEDTTLGGEIDLNRGTVDKFMTITGSARGQLEDDAGNVYEATLEGSFYVRFISGAPLPVGAVGRATGELTATGSSAEPMVVLDGSESWDELGASIVAHEWIAYLPESPSLPVLIGKGERVQLPLAHWMELVDSGVEPLSGASSYGRVCLRVRDGDQMRDETCFEPGYVPPPPSPNDPGVPMLGCGEAIRGLPYLAQFAELLDASDLGGYAGQFPDATWIVPTDSAIDDKLFRLLLRPSAKERLNEFVANHLFAGAVPLDYLHVLEHSESMSGYAVESNLADDIVVHDMPCSGGSFIQVSRSVVEPDKSSGGGGPGPKPLPIGPGGGPGPGCSMLGC